MGLADDGWGIQLGSCSPSDVSTDPVDKHQPLGALAGEDGLGTTNDGCGGRGEAYRPGKGVGGRSCGWCKGMEGGRTKNFLIQIELNCVNFFLTPGRFKKHLFSLTCV